MLIWEKFLDLPNGSSYHQSPDKQESQILLRIHATFASLPLRNCGWVSESSETTLYSGRNHLPPTILYKGPNSAKVAKKGAVVNLLYMGPNSAKVAKKSAVVNLIQSREWFRLLRSLNQ